MAQDRLRSSFLCNFCFYIREQFPGSGGSGLSWDIFTASKAGDLDRVRYLVDFGVVSINARDEWNSTPLFYACLCGHKDMVKFLLDNGAKLQRGTFDTERSYYGALTPEIQDILNNYKTNPNKMDHFGEMLGRMLDAARFTDICFYVDKRPIRAHKFVLATRSPFMKELLRTRWLTRSEVRFGAAALEYDAFEAFIRYLYTGQLNIPLSMVAAFYKICDHCKIPELRNTVESELDEAMRDRRDRIILDPNPSRRSELKQNIRESYKFVRLDTEEELEKETMFLQGDEAKHHYYFADACLVLEEDGIEYRYYCHKSLLSAQSGYFSGLLSGSFKEARGDENITFIRLSTEDVTPKVLSLAVEFMYSNLVPDVDEELATQMLGTASIYLLDDLKRMSITRLCRLTTEENVYDILDVAELYQSVRLRDYAVDYIEDHFSAVWNRSELAELLQNGSPAIVAHLEHVIEEYNEIHSVNIKQLLGLR